MSRLDLRARLQELHKTTAETPLFNPVFQLSLDVSREIESGALSLSGVESYVAELECEALQSRASRLIRLLSPVQVDDNLAAFRALVEASASGDLEDFEDRWSRPFVHVVFTGHPTFLLNAAQSDAVAAAASSGNVSAAVCDVEAARTGITLDGEHSEVMAAMRRASVARDALSKIILDVAAAQWPDEWRSVRPMPFRLASWVGYDMDGRTDIGWTTSIKYRLIEKAERLRGYATLLSAIGCAPALCTRLTAAEARSRTMAETLDADLDAPEALSRAANILTADHPAKMLSLDPVISELERLAVSESNETASAPVTRGGHARRWAWHGLDPFQDQFLAIAQRDPTPD